MRNLLLPLMLASVLIGCSKQESKHESPKEPSQTARPPAQPSASLPFKITIVESPETKDKADIKKQAAALLQNHDYAQLEALAAKYGASKEHYPGGSWPLTSVYDGLALSDDAPESTWQEYEENFKAWMKAKPTSATARLAMAYFLRDYAWQARGSGWASTVKEEAWKTFGDRLNQAWELLDGIHDPGNQRPIYWSIRLRLALGLQLDRAQYDKIFRQAIAADPGFEGHYNTRAIFLLPRWYGTDGEWETDLAKSADALKGDDGDMLYAQVAWYVHGYGAQNVFRENQLLSWPRVDRGFTVIEKCFPNSVSALNEHAHLAYLAGDVQKARQCMTQMDGKADLSEWDDEDQFIRVANWAFAK